MIRKMKKNFLKQLDYWIYFIHELFMGIALFFTILEYT